MSPEQKNRALALRKTTLTDAEIAQQLTPPVSRQTLYKALGPRRGPQDAPRERKPRTPLPKPAPGEFAKRLKEWRIGRGLSQAEAADTLGVTPQSIWTWENEDGGCALPATVLLTLDLLDFHKMMSG
jgi:DNA-binding XRE family transcriptional regulator